MFPLLMNPPEWLVHLSGDEDHVHHRMWLTEKGGRMGRAVAIFILAGLFVSVHLLGVASIAVAAGKTVILHVDDGAAPGGTGSGMAPFNNLPDAVATARILGAGVVVNVEPGNYPLVSPLVIDFPLVLRGSTEQVVDVDDPWPTGSVVPGTQTRVFAAAPMGARSAGQCRPRRLGCHERRDHSRLRVRGRHDD